MTQEKRPIGFKENIDKLLFILATGYLILIVAWFFKPVKTQTNVSTYENLKTKTVVDENLSDQNHSAVVLNSDKLQAENIEEGLAESSLIAASPLVKESMPSLSAFQLGENPPIPPQSLPVISVSSPPPLSSLSSSSSETVNNSSTLPQPLKVPIPPPPKASTSSKVTSLPVLNSPKNDISYRPENSLPPPSSTENIEETKDSENTNLNYSYSLVGLIKLDDQSDLALFKINNSTQRVRVGEEIGTTGWRLIAINENQVVINQLGETIRLTMGDKF